MKKIILIFAVLALSLCLFGCKKNNNNNNNKPGDVVTNPDGSVDLPIIDVEFD